MQKETLEKWFGIHVVSCQLSCNRQGIQNDFTSLVEQQTCLINLWYSDSSLSEKMTFLREWKKPTGGRM